MALGSEHASTEWVDDSAPYISAAQLNRIEADLADTNPTFEDITLHADLPRIVFKDPDLGDPFLNIEAFLNAGGGPASNSYYWRFRTYGGGTVLLMDDEKMWGPMLAWRQYTPTLTNLTLGDGSMSAAYARIGDTVTGQFRFTLGSTSAVGSNPTFTLPFDVATNQADQTIGWCRYTDGGSPNYGGTLLASGSSNATLQALNTSGTYAVNTNISATVPFTWANTDVIRAQYTYRAAPYPDDE